MRCVRSHRIAATPCSDYCSLGDLQTFWNGPIGLQLVGRCQEEEAVIAMTEIVDVALKKWNPSKL